jgi:hypothetical protein
VVDLTPYLASLAAALLVGLLVGFALGTGENIRRGNAILAWLQGGGLRLLGRRTTLRWLGSSAVELRLVDPPDPFRAVTVTVVLEPRDLFWLWALSRRRGRRDFLILRADLRRAPRLELQLADPAGWTAGEVVQRLDDPQEGWRRLSWSTTPLAAWRGQGNPDRLRPTLDRIAAASGVLWRLSVSQTVPHLQLHLRPPDPRRTSSAALLGPVRDLANLVTREG